MKIETTQYARFNANGIEVISFTVHEFRIIYVYMYITPFREKSC
jgi:hypothetical protein